MARNLRGVTLPELDRLVQTMASSDDSESSMRLRRFYAIARGEIQDDGSIELALTSFHDEVVESLRVRGLIWTKASAERSPCGKTKHMVYTHFLLPAGEKVIAERLI